LNRNKSVRGDIQTERKMPKYKNTKIQKCKKSTNWQHLSLL